MAVILHAMKLGQVYENKQQRPNKARRRFHIYGKRFTFSTLILQLNELLTQLPVQISSYITTSSKGIVLV